MELIAEEDVQIYDAKRIMKQREKERELVYDQKICLDYLDKITPLTQKQLESLLEELAKISILKPRYTALIVNAMPDTEEEVEALFAKERTNLKKEEVKQIVSIVGKYKK